MGVIVSLLSFSNIQVHEAERSVSSLLCDSLNVLLWSSMHGGLCAFSGLTYASI